METFYQSAVIRDMARVERPIQRLSDLGTSALKDTELLALALRGKSLDTMAEILLKRPLGELVDMSYANLSAIKGVGAVAAASFLATLEIAKRTQRSTPSTLPVIMSTNDIVSQSVELRHLKKEHLVAFFVNARHQLIAKETISIGTLTASLAHPREIFAPAIGQAAAGVILVHNHPSGDSSPSEEHSIDPTDRPSWPNYGD